MQEHRPGYAPRALRRGGRHCGARSVVSEVRNQVLSDIVGLFSIPSRDRIEADAQRRGGFLQLGYIAGALHGFELRKIALGGIAGA